MSKPWLWPFVIGIACGGAACAAAVSLSSGDLPSSQPCWRTSPALESPTAGPATPDDMPSFDSGNGWLTGKSTPSKPS